MEITKIGTAQMTPDEPQVLKQSPGRRVSRRLCGKDPRKVSSDELDGKIKKKEMKNLLKKGGRGDQKVEAC